MNPELFTTNRNKLNLKLLVVAFAALILFIIIAVLMPPRLRLEEQRLSRTPLTYNQNYGHLSGSELYAYNGLAFYKINLSANNSIKVLSSGIKLPVPGAVYWADSRGALLNFKESFTMTRVEEALRASGQSLDRSTQSYTWYLDFASGSLRLVNHRPVQQGRALFVEGKGFYYMPDNSQVDDHEVGEFAVDATPLHFYNIQTGQDETISNDLGVTDPSYLGKCSSVEHRVCFIARDVKDTHEQRLYAISPKNQKTQLLAAERLFPSNSSALFVTVGEEGEHQEDVEEESADGHVERQVVFDERPARLHNIKEKTVANMGFAVGDTDILTHFKSPEEFYLIDNTLITSPVSSTSKKSSYRAGTVSSGGKVKASLLPLLYNDERVFTGGLINLVSHGVGGKALVTSLDGSHLLFTSKQSAKDLEPLGLSSAQEVVERCTRTHATDNQYFEEGKLFKIFFTDDPGFSGNIQTFSSCINKADPLVNLGYNFYLGAVDPFNGRITTD